MANMSPDLAVIIFSCSIIVINVDASVKYQMKPLQLGAEIIGIKLRDHVNDSQLFDQIKSDTHKYRLLIFRDQGELEGDSMMRMFQGFGEIYHRPFTTQTKHLVNHEKAPAPAIMRISNDPNEGFKGVGTSGWHIDGAYKEMPFSFLIFNSVKAPKIGDTKFAGHKEMLASLPKETLDKLDRMWGVNTRRVLGEKVASIHPLIYNHPIVNESVLCVHLGYMHAAISDLGDPDERVLSNSELLKMKGDITYGFNRDEKLIYSHRWRDGDLVIVDNLQVSHLASKESQMPKEKVGLRILHRLAINGIQKPTKKQ